METGLPSTVHSLEVLLPPAASSRPASLRRSTPTRGTSCTATAPGSTSASPSSTSSRNVSGSRRNGRRTETGRRTTAEPAAVYATGTTGVPSDTRGGRRPSPQAGCCQGNRQERLNWTATVRARPLVDALIRRSQHNSPLTPPSFLALRHRSRVRLPLSWSERLQHFLSIKTTAQSPNRIVEP